MARAVQSEIEVYRPSGGILALRRLVRAVVGGYMRLWHRLELEHGERLPAAGPALFLTNHVSLLDVPSMMVLDPYPNTAIVAKASLFRIPLVRDALRAWGGISVDRDGRDSSGVRALLTALRQGRPVAVAAEGHRSRSGKLEPTNPVLARIAISSGVPIVPIGIVGSYRALPPGAVFPRPRKVSVRVGEPFRLERKTPEDVAARRIYDAIRDLLPREQWPTVDPYGRDAPGAAA